jgi:NarL family two-component system response regulator LiaR
MDMTDIVIRVGVVDDEPNVRDAMRYWFNQNAGFQCVGAWGSVEEAMESLRWKKPHVLLLDLHLGGKTSVGQLRAIKQALPVMAVVMLTSEEDYYWVQQALQQGADGYMLKKTAAESLGAALRDVLRGGSPLSAEISRKMIREHIAPAARNDELESLTPRERMVLQKLSEGLVYKEIADVCDISLETVRTHARRILKKLGVGSKTEAVLKYLKASRAK